MPTTLGIYAEPQSVSTFQTTGIVLMAPRFYKTGSNRFGIESDSIAVFRHIVGVSGARIHNSCPSETSDNSRGNEVGHRSMMRGVRPYSGLVKARIGRPEDHPVIPLKMVRSSFGLRFLSPWRGARNNPTLTPPYSARICWRQPVAAFRLRGYSMACALGGFIGTTQDRDPGGNQTRHSRHACPSRSAVPRASRLYGFPE